MRRRDLAKALILCLIIGMTTPVLAADDTLDKVVDGSLVITRLGGVGAALVLGTPVATMRLALKSYIDFTESAAEKIGGKDLGPACLVASIVTLPAGLAVGTVKGLYYGSKNAFTHGFNEPFSPASFSLGKLEE